jgi:hypothetical protein
MASAIVNYVPGVGDGVSRPVGVENGAGECSFPGLAMCGSA